MAKRTLYYTFGNHMHWVDMQWLWGYDVLPGSVRDMLHLCHEAGVKGNVNFDAVGYEKMAAECPEALADLREAIAAGVIEPVGCSYGQPYGLFNGGESNVRQFTYGVRSTRRLLGVRPRTFWEEEFYFFPQLPQILQGCGYDGACLFFQWTWHTPELPREPLALILWEGIDGSALPTLPRNELNVHQWPEEFAGLLEHGLINELETPAIVQWIELMPSRDWMCRSEVLLPPLIEFMNDERFEVQPCTASVLIDALKEQHPEPPRRHYTMDDVWHGMTLGKNADRHPRASRLVERTIQTAESLSAIASLFGRPYPSWDVYPTWELDEAWRELLAAQHHDNHECEGLCGFVGHRQFEKANALAIEVGDRTLRHLMDRAGGHLAENALGFAHCKVVENSDTTGTMTIPPFGFAANSAVRHSPSQQPVEITEREHTVTLKRADLSVEIDVERGLITQIRSREFPDGVLDTAHPLLTFEMRMTAEAWRRPDVAEYDIDENEGSITLSLNPDPTVESRPASRTARFFNDLGERSTGMQITITLAPRADAVDMALLDLDEWGRPDPGLKASLRMPIAFAFRSKQVRCDSPYAVHVVDGSGPVRRKYPSGDWMTSEQWFEELEGSIVAHSFIDRFDQKGNGVQISHNGSPQVFRNGDAVEFVLTAHDPWDELRYEVPFFAPVAFRIEPHGPRTNADCVRCALVANAEWNDNWPGEHGALEPETHPGAVGGGGPAVAGTVPPVFGGPTVENAANVLATAFCRESMKSGEHLPNWVGHRMCDDSHGACDHPFVIRLVEYNGEQADVVLKLPGPVALAAKTNLMGEVRNDHSDTHWLDVEYPVDPPAWAAQLNEPIIVRGEDLQWSQVRFRMRPREIATIYADLVIGRKEWRNLDEKREVWATIHKTSTSGDE